MPTSHLLVTVFARVLPDQVEAFRAAALANAAASIREPGVVRFDVAQESGDPTRFVLIEVYRGPDGAAAHKETAHYQTWRDTVAPMMAEPRTNKSYATVTPAATWAFHARV
jgi:(4S)-4-hydroxy-5-phosphonooxypentane-2,3-dione isomerase